MLIHQNLLKNVDLANLKSNVDKLDIDKLKNVPTNLTNLKNKVDKLDVDKWVPTSVVLSKLSDVVKNGVFKKDVYNTKIKSIENKIPNISNWVKKLPITENLVKLTIKLQLIMAIINTLFLKNLAS